MFVLSIGTSWSYEMWWTWELDLEGNSIILLLHPFINCSTQHRFIVWGILGALERYVSFGSSFLCLVECNLLWQIYHFPPYSRLFICLGEFWTLLGCMSLNFTTNKIFSCPSTAPLGFMASPSRFHCFLSHESCIWKHQNAPYSCMLMFLLKEKRKRKKKSYVYMHGDEFVLSSDTSNGW